VCTRDELLAPFLDAAANIKKHKDQLRRTTHGLGTPLQSAQGFAVGFSNIYCELRQIYHFCVMNLSFKY